jgi:hypothetical protein
MNQLAPAPPRPDYLAIFLPDRKIPLFQRDRAKNRNAYRILMDKISPISGTGLLTRGNSVPACSSRQDEKTTVSYPVMEAAHI